VINSAFADIVGESELSVVDFAANYAELAERVREEVLSRIDDEYGLAIPQLFIVNISLPAEVEKALDARTSINALGDMGVYQAYQIGSAIPTAAENPAGGIAGAGLGVGMGMAMAGPMMGSVAGAAPAAAPPPLPAAWHVAENGQPVGPVPLAQLGEWVASGRLTRQTLVWSGGMAQWAPAGQVPQLAGLFPSTPPPVPGA
jgi:hypothetical protein